MILSPQQRFKLQLILFIIVNYLSHVLQKNNFKGPSNNTSNVQERLIS